ncbi:MAG: VTT domain-containing protein [Chloroflexales bacterium]|nr:VTT domain-containing protein [Chloroflexales bacterium]
MLTMLGLAIGSALAVTTGRLLGTVVVRKLVPPAVLAHFDGLVNEANVWTFLLIFLAPVFPDDAICIMAGLTRLSIWQVALVSVIGRLPFMAALTYLGATAGQLSGLIITLIALTLIAGVILIL